MDSEITAVEVLKALAVDSGRLLVDRRRAFAALTPLRETAVPASTYIGRTAGTSVPKRTVGTPCPAHQGMVPHWYGPIAGGRV